MGSSNTILKVCQERYSFDATHPRIVAVMGTKKRILFAEGEQISNMEYMITSRRDFWIWYRERWSDDSLMNVVKLGWFLMRELLRKTEFAKEGGKFGSLTFILVGNFWHCSTWNGGGGEIYSVMAKRGTTFLWGGGSGREHYLDHSNPPRTNCFVSKVARTLFPQYCDHRK